MVRARTLRAMREMLPGLVELEIVATEHAANFERLLDQGAALLEASEADQLSDREEWLIEQAFLKAWEFCLPSSLGESGATPADVARRACGFMQALRDELEQRRRSDRPTQPPAPISEVEAAAQ